MTNLVAFALPALYYIALIALFTYLLMRGVTHLFLALFTIGAVLHFAQMLAYILLDHLPGGFNAHSVYLPILEVVGGAGSLVFLAAFIALASFLLRETNAPPRPNE